MAIRRKLFFSGIAKFDEGMRRALEVGIHCFNIESAPELFRLNEIAGSLGKVAPISIRVNPDINANTHPYISTGLKDNKFGVDVDSALQLYAHAKTLPHVAIKGIDCHIGSQLTSLEPFLAAAQRLLVMVDKLKQIGITLEHIDLGGGLGVPYQNEILPQPHDYAQALFKKLRALPYQIIIEPGRAIAGNAGILVTQVEYIKETPYKKFAIVDIAMNDFLRPALYQAQQTIIEVNQNLARTQAHYDVVGPVCETADFMAKNAPLRIAAQDLLAIRTAGAYGFVMSSNYNARARAAEVMVDGAHAYCVRPREKIDELFSTEQLLPGVV